MNQDQTTPAGEKNPLLLKFEEFMVALSLANLCFIRTWCPPLYDSNFAYCSKILGARMTVLALLANILGLTLLIFAAMLLMRRLNNKRVDFAGHCLFLFSLLLPANFIRTSLIGVPVADLVKYLHRPWLIPICLALLAFVFWQHRNLARIQAVALGIVSPFAIFTLLKLAMLGLNVGPLAQPTPQGLINPLDHAQPDAPRVVWIIFDETDQRLLFDARPDYLKVPEFDRLRNESLCATNALPPGGRTLVSMPALICGQKVSVGPIRRPSDLRLTLTDTGQMTNWSQLPSVFSAARQMAINTALIGWYHPYSRVLARSLTYCSWYPYPDFGNPVPEGFWRSIRGQMVSLIKGADIRRLEVELCRSAFSESLSVITNRDYGLLLLHLPPPHPPWIYSPQSNCFTIADVPLPTGYFNNLMLADLWLGKFRQALDASAGISNRTWLIVSADHSWRDSPEYDGQSDPRVPFLVKAPGQQRPISYSPRINTVITHDLILAILRRDIRDEQNVAVWLDTHTNAPVTTPR